MSVNTDRKDFSKSSLSLFFQNRGITYKSWNKYFSSSRAFYNRSAKPDSILLVEAIRIAKEQKITLEELVRDLKELGMKFY